MEWFFQRCSHPDMEQRLQMARDLELAEPKVKYWFQNRRNQLKISALKAENEIWKKECLRLQEENQSFRAISSRIVVPLLRTVEPATSALLPGVQFTEELKHAVMNIASQCIVELRMMCESREPLWNRANDGKAILDIAQYNRMFPWGSSSNEHLRIEASLWSTYVLMNSGDLVDTFCDAEKWMQMFPSIVSKAKTLHIVQDSENFNGSLYLIVDGGSKENFLQELARISTGGSPANCISLFRIYHANSTQECVLHECCSDDSESVVAYTALSEDGIAKLGTADSASIQILTNGFVLVPIQQGSGCLLTVGIQSLASMNPYENLSLLGAMASQRHLDEIISRIKEVLSGRTANK
ncbi:hypothetical protein AG4045_013145 [Apium graveolens]|uniref:Homeobox domain-containing protein n=1 Tax=Apium graveolens TaxID=4045 RepID=A0A6L5B8K9_APIGR|nr:hypothetical protein AG4045_013145 [Apium graveolens]